MLTGPQLQQIINERAQQEQLSREYTAAVGAAEHEERRAATYRERGQHAQAKEAENMALRYRARASAYVAPAHVQSYLASQHAINEAGRAFVAGDVHGFREKVGEADRLQRQARDESRRRR